VGEGAWAQGVLVPSSSTPSRPLKEGRKLYALTNKQAREELGLRSMSTVGPVFSHPFTGAVFYLLSNQTTSLVTLCTSQHNLEAEDQ